MGKTLDSLKNYQIQTLWFWIITTNTQKYILFVNKLWISSNCWLKWNCWISSFIFITSLSNKSLNFLLTVRFLQKNYLFNSLKVFAKLLFPFRSRQPFEFSKQNILKFIHYMKILFKTFGVINLNKYYNQIIQFRWQKLGQAFAYMNIRDLSSDWCVKLMEKIEFSE